MTKAGVVCVLIFSVVSGGVGYLIGSLRSTFQTVTDDPNFGRFFGEPEAKWLTDGRDMKLVKDFVFVDSRGRSWLAERDTVINGASIPKFLWSIVGSPFAGQYRNASIVHDAECDRKLHPSSDVHRMFYDACRAGGVKERDAKFLYWAVANHGPSWTIEKVQTVAAAPNPVGASLTETPPMVTVSTEPETEPTPEELEWAKRYFETEDPPIDLVPYLQPPTNDEETTPQV